VFVVYYNALHRNLLDRSALFQEVASGGPPELAEPWAIFRARSPDPSH
jgi:hypothetical protein